jgi:hypothetical protein
VSCGGALHSARYSARPEVCRPGSTDRRIAGGPASAAVDRCRQCNTPPSLRFLCRRVYLATMMVLISAMLHGATPPRVARLSQLLGVCRRTLARWREWWRTAFVQSRFWQAARATFMPAGCSRSPAGRPIARGPKLRQEIPEDTQESPTPPPPPVVGVGSNCFAFPYKCRRSWKSAADLHEGQMGGLGKHIRGFTQTRDNMCDLRAGGVLGQAHVAEFALSDGVG